MSEQDGDLVSLLSVEQRGELVLLIATATEYMRKTIEAIFDTPPPPPRRRPASDSGSKPGGDVNPSTSPGDQKEVAPEESSENKKEPETTSTTLEKEKEKEKSNLPTPKLQTLRKQALASFDTWRDSVLERICPVLHSRSTHQNPPAPSNAAAAPQNIKRKPLPHSDSQDLSKHYPPIPTPLSTSLAPGYAPMIIQAVLLLLLSLKHYDSRSRTLLLLLTSSFHLPLSTLTAQESYTASTLLKADLMNADAESQKRIKSSKLSRRLKVGFASVAGAAVIGLTGGLAAPLVAAGIGGVLGGVGLGATAAAGYLGVVTGSGVIVGALFGAYGGTMTGKMVQRYAAEVEDFAFVPVRDKEKRLRVTVGISGWLTKPEDVVDPWKALNNNSEVYALRWETSALLDLGTTLKTLLTSTISTTLKATLIKYTVLAPLAAAALLPLSLLNLSRVLDNPFTIAKNRSEKAGAVLADAIINKAQGERPISLFAFSLGARVIYACLLSLAERGAFGLVADVVLMGAPVPDEREEWMAMRAVVAGRLVNVYSERDYVLRFLYRTSSVQRGVSGLGSIEGVPGVENVDVGGVVEGHLKYGILVGGLLAGFLGGEVDPEEKKILRELVEMEEMETEKVDGGSAEMGEGREDDIEEVVTKAERELEERRRQRQRRREWEGRGGRGPGGCGERKDVV